MNKTVKKSLIIFGAIALALTIPSADKILKAAKNDALFDDPVVAKGKGFEIKRSQLDDAVVSYKANAAAVNEPVPEKRNSSLEAELLNELILTEILLQKATDIDKAKGKDSAKELIAGAQARATSEAIFKMRLRALGLTGEVFENEVLRQETRKTVLKREVADKIEIKDEAIKKFYDENPAEFDRPEKVHVAHILISTIDQGKPVSPDKKKEKEALAKSLKERAEKGENFASLVKEFSDDPGSRSKNGEYIFGRNEMVPAFEKAAFALRQGQISDVVETQYGFHVIKLLEKMQARTVSLEEATPKIKEYLVAQELNKILPDYYEKLKAEYATEILDGKLKNAVAEARKEAAGTLKQ